MPGKSVRRRIAVQLFKKPMNRACIGWDVDDPDLLSGSKTCIAAVLSELVGERDLPRTQEEGAPVHRCAALATSRCSGLASTIGEHVGDSTGCSGVDLRELVEAQQGIAVRDSHPLETVVGRSPLPNIAVERTPTPDRAGDKQCRALP